MKNSHKGLILGLLCAVVVFTIYFLFTKKPTAIFEESTSNLGSVVFDTPTVPTTEQGRLPGVVEAKKQAIIKAVKAKDYKQLASLTSGANFSYDLGCEAGGECTDLETFWKKQDQSYFDTLIKLFDLPYTEWTDPTTGVKSYVWPSVFFQDPKTFTQEDLAMIKKVQSDEDRQKDVSFWEGNYFGYRTFIDQGGNWTMYFYGTD